MKKLLLAMPVALCICCTSCSDKGGGGMSDAAKKNLDAMHGVQKCFETKDFSKVGDYIAADAVDHASMSGHDVKGLDSIKAEMVRMGGMSEGDKTEIIKELADDEWVMSFCRYTGTSKTDEGGMKAGAKFDLKGVEVVKFKDGKAIEHWSMADMRWRIAIRRLVILYNPSITSTFL